MKGRSVSTYQCTGSQHRRIGLAPWAPVGSIDISTSGPMKVNCGTEEDPEWFTCCELTKIQRRRADGLTDAVPAEEVFGTQNDSRRDVQ